MVNLVTPLYEWEYKLISTFSGVIGASYGISATGLKAFTALRKAK